MMANKKATYEEACSCLDCCTAEEFRVQGPQKVFEKLDAALTKIGWTQKELCDEAAARVIVRLREKQGNK